VGLHHETIGASLLAVLHSLQHLAGDDSRATRRVGEKILGAEEVRRIEAVNPDGWYSIVWLLQMMETLDGKLGRFGLLKMGRTLFKLSHQERVLREAQSAWDLVHSFDAMYRRTNRGQQIGGWRVRAFHDDRAELEKTTPHHCAMEEGVLAQALTTVGAPAVVNEERCFRDGAESCHFVILRAGAGRWR
jgi:hypothetical protein